MKNKINVAILLFNEVEVLDFAGPFEVFSITESIVNNKKLFNTFTVSQHSELIRARNGLQVLPEYTFDNCPQIDILIIPGGYGAEEVEINNQVLLKWIKDKYKEVKSIASVCTGAFLLAESGIITNHKVTTHWMDINKLKKQYPRLEVIKDVKYVDQGKIFTSAGISAGIELSLYIVSKYFNLETAKNTARRMEYDWNE